GSGDTILIGVTGTIILTNGELSIGHTLTIVGPGPASLTVQRTTAAGAMEFRIFHISGGNVLISGLTVNNGRANVGAGIENGDSVSSCALLLTNIVVTGNVATNMAGADCTGG